MCHGGKCRCANTTEVMPAYLEDVFVCFCRDVGVCVGAGAIAVAYFDIW